MSHDRGPRVWGIGFARAAFVAGLVAGFASVAAAQRSPPPQAVQVFLQIHSMPLRGPASTVDSVRMRKTAAGTGAIGGGAVGATVGGASFYHFGRCVHTHCARASVAFLGPALGAGSGAIVGAAIGYLIRR